MKKVLLVILVMLAVPLIAGGFTGQVDLTSRFIWRGFDLLPDNHSALQPLLIYEVRKTGLSFTLFGSFALSGRDVYKDVDELDLTVQYASNPGEDFSLAIGFTHYGWYFADDFSFKDNTTQEVYVTAGLPNVFLSPSLSLYYDLNLYKGFYAALNGKHSLKLSEKLNLDLSAGLGYNSNFGIDASGISDLTVGAVLPLPLGKLTVSPFMRYCLVFLDEVNEENNEFWFGVSLIF